MYKSKDWIEVKNIQSELNWLKLDNGLEIEILNNSKLSTNSFIDIMTNLSKLRLKKLWNYTKLLSKSSKVPLWMSLKYNRTEISMEIDQGWSHKNK